MSQDEYVVEKIVGKRILDNCIQYRVKWEGYSMEESTWEPYKNVKHLKDLIEEYEKLENIKQDIKQKDCAPRANTKNKASNGMKFDNGMEVREIIESDWVPQKVQTVREVDGKLYASVSWSESSDGTIPDDCWVPSEILSDVHPKVLISFYEAKIKFVKKK
jgi:hypothetical protein